MGGKRIETLPGASQFAELQRRAAAVARGTRCAETRRRAQALGRLASELSRLVRCRKAGEVEQMISASRALQALTELVETQGIDGAGAVH